MKQQGMGHRKMVGGDEYDALTGWQRLYKYLQRAGARSKVKTRARRRERRTTRQELK